VARFVPKSLLEVLPGPGDRQERTWSRGDADGIDADLPGGTDGTGATDGETGGPSRRRRRLPRWWLAVAAVILATAVALPVRSTVAVNELHRLDSRWAWFEAVDGQRAHLEAQLATDAQDPTDIRVTKGRAALDAEEASLLGTARLGLMHGRHLPDAGLGRLRRAMALAFADQAADLRAGKAPSEAPPATTAAIFRAVQLLNAELGRWQQEPVKRPASVARLSGADQELAQLALPVDSPIAAGLVFVGPEGTVTTVDLAARSGAAATSRLTLPSPTPLSGPVVSRTGWLAVNAAASAVDTGLVYAVQPDLSGDPRVIGATEHDVLVPAADPKGVWLQSGQGAVEVDANGATLQGPVAIPAGRTVIGATDQLLVTSGLTALQAADDLQVVAIHGVDQGHSVVLTARGQLVAAAAGHLAWLEQSVDGTSVIKLADGSARGVRTIAPPLLTNVDPTPANVAVPRALPVDTGAFSPDGTTLAMRDLTVSRSAADLQLALIDVATGATRLIDGSIGDKPTGIMLWAPAGDRVFFTVARSRQPVHIGMWQVGAASPTTIRVSTPSLLALAVTGR
jgi:hypothetical protein